MGKYLEPFEDTISAFELKIHEAGLDVSTNVKIITDNKLKPEIFSVKKCSPIEKYKTGDDVNIFLNEDIFLKLPADLQNLTIVEALAWISYNSEKDAVSVDAPDFKAHSLVLVKHSFQEVMVLKESIKTLLQVQKEAEDAIKAANKKGKK